MSTKPKPDTPEEAEKTPGSGEVADTPTDKPEDAKTITQEEHQKELDRIAAKVRAEEKQKYDTAQSDAEKKRQEKELKEQGKLQELADTRERERDEAVAERDDYKSRYDTLAERVKANLDAEIKALELPEHVADLVPTDLNALLEWLPKAKQAAEKEAAEREPIPGSRRGPRIATDAATDKAARESQSRLYRSL